MYHKTPWDPTAWHDPKKEETGFKEDDDPKLYNNKKPWNKKKTAEKTLKTPVK